MQWMKFTALHLLWQQAQQGWRRQQAVAGDRASLAQNAHTVAANTLSLGLAGHHACIICSVSTWISRHRERGELRRLSMFKRVHELSDAAPPTLSLCHLV